MVQTAEQSGQTLGVAYYRRCYPKVQRAKQLLAAGVLGKPVIAELTCHSWFNGQGSRSWLVDPAKAGGGPLFDIASHRIDVLNFLFGQPLRASGQLSNVVHHYAVEDNATVMIEYAGGVRGVVEAASHLLDRDRRKLREKLRPALPDRRSELESCVRVRAIEILRNELDVTMALCGVSNVRDLDRRVIVPTS